MNKNYEHIKRYRKKLKRDLIRLFGDKCCICGYDEYKSALEFHHINPKEKEFAISSYRHLNKEKVLNEAIKCALICSNCHNALHSGELQTVFDYYELDKDDVKEFLKNPKKEYDHCPICGNMKETRFDTCSLKCSGIKRRRVNWDDVNLKELLIEGKGWNEIGELVGISGNGVKKRAKMHNLLQYYSDPRKKK